MSEFTSHNHVGGKLASGSSGSVNVPTRMSKAIWTLARISHRCVIPWFTKHPDQWCMVISWYEWHVKHVCKTWPVNDLDRAMMGQGCANGCHVTAAFHSEDGPRIWPFYRKFVRPLHSYDEPRDHITGYWWTIIWDDSIRISPSWWWWWWWLYCPSANIIFKLHQ